MKKTRWNYKEDVNHKMKEAALYLVTIFLYTARSYNEANKKFDYQQSIQSLLT